MLTKNIVLLYSDYFFFSKSFAAQTRQKKKEKIIAATSSYFVKVTVENLTDIPDFFTKLTKLVRNEAQNISSCHLLNTVCIQSILFFTVVANYWLV